MYQFTRNASRRCSGQRRGWIRGLQCHPAADVAQAFLPVLGFGPPRPPQSNANPLFRRNYWVIHMRNLLMVSLATCAALAAGPAGDSVPLVFIANHGQAPEAVRFMVKGSGLTAFFSPEAAWFRVGEA